MSYTSFAQVYAITQSGTKLEVLSCDDDDDQHGDDLSPRPGQQRADTDIELSISSKIAATITITMVRVNDTQIKCSVLQSSYSLAFRMATRTGIVHNLPFNLPL